MAAFRKHTHAIEIDNINRQLSPGIIDGFGLIPSEEEVLFLNSVVSTLFYNPKS